MTDDTWTVTTLKEHVDQRLDDLEAHIDQRFAQAALAVSVGLAAAEKAVLKAEAAAERRFESVNEFRAQLADQAATFVARETYDAQMESVKGQLSELRDRTNVTAGRAVGMTALWGWLLGAAGLGAAIVSLATR